MSDIVKKMFGNKVNLVTGEPPAGSSAKQAEGRGWYMGRRQLNEYKANVEALQKVRDERRGVLYDIQNKGDTPARQAAKAALDDKEAELLKQTQVLGTIYLSPHLAEREQLPTLYHETVHAAFDIILNPEERAVLATAFSRGIGRKQLEKIFADDPAVLAQIKDPEEAAAYGFQLYATQHPELNLGPKTNTIFEKVVNWFRKIFKVATTEEKANLMMSSMLSGQRAETGLSPLTRKLAKDMTLHERLAKMATGVGKVAGDFYDMMAQGNYNRMVGTNNPALAQIADAAYLKTGMTGNNGYIQQQRNAATDWINRTNKMLDKYDPATWTAVQQAKLSGVTPTEPKVKAAWDEVTQHFRDFHTYAREVPGLQIGHESNYWPMVWDAEKVMQGRDAFLTMLKQPKYAEYMDKLKVTPTELWENISGYVTRGESFQDIVGKSGEPANDYARERSLSFLDPVERTPFMESNVQTTLAHYTHQMTRQAEYVRAFGPNGSKLSNLEKTGWLDEAEHKYGATKAQLALAKDYVDSALGNREVGMSRELKDAYGGLIAYENYRLLPFNLFSSLVDPLGISIRSNRIADAFETFGYATKNLFRDLKADRPDADKDYYERLAESWGIIADAGAQANLQHQMETVELRGWAKIANDGLFKWNLLNGWTRSTRIMAVKAAQRFMLDSTKDGTHGERYLKELGLSQSDIMAKPDGELALRKEDLQALGVSADQAAEIENRLRQATMKFVNQAILDPTSADIPNWGSNPYLAPIFHLKQYAFTFQNVILSRVMQEMKEGNLKPLWVAGMYVPMSIGADLTKNYMLGLGSLPDWQKNWGAWDYLQRGVERSGLLGSGQMLSAIKDDTMHGGKGYETAAGPLIEQMLQGVQAATKGGVAMENFGLKALPLYQIPDKIFMQHTSALSGQSS